MPPRPFLRLSSYAAACFAAVLTLSLSSCGSVSSSQERVESASARYIPGPEKSVLQTPCYRLVDRRGRKVELTGAVHIAEKAYYQDLNRHLRSFDAVLYEGVGSPRSKKGGDKERTAAVLSAPRRPSDISRIYSTMAHDYLHMALQGEEIDYDRPNFIHADVTREEFEAILKKHGLTMDTVVKKNRFSPGLATSRWLLNVMKFLVPKGDPDAVKRLAAPGLARAESDRDMPRKAYEVIIVERDRHLLQVLDRQLAAGKRNVSLFYGSGHFPDLRQQLHARGWKDAGVEWRDAWVIQEKPKR